MPVPTISPNGSACHSLRAIATCVALIFTEMLTGCASTRLAGEHRSVNRQLLFDAQFNGPPEVLRALDNGADINVRAKDGSTALHVSARRPDPSVATVLVGRGAQPNFQDSLGDTPLHVAVLAGHSELSRQLVIAGANEQALNSFDLRPLQMADVREAQAEVRQLTVISRHDRNWYSDEAQPSLAKLRASDPHFVQAALYYMAIRSPDPRPIVKLVFKLRIDGMEQFLVRILNDTGSVEVAEQLLNSAVGGLPSAARTWAAANNYAVCRGPRTSGPPQCIPVLNFEHPSTAEAR